MKKILLSLCVLAGVAFTSCEGNKQAYTIIGTVPTTVADSTVVYFKVADIDFKGELSKDSTYVKAGHFTFTGVADSLQRMGTVFLGEEAAKRYSASIVVEPGEIGVVLDSISTVSGTKANADKHVMLTLERIYKDALKEAKAHIAEAGGSDTPQGKVIVEAFSEVDEAFNAEWKEYTKANITSQDGVMRLLTKSYAFDLNEKKELLAQIPAQLKEAKGVQKLMANVEALEKTAVGEMFTDVVGKDVAGREIALADYAGRGKYVLVDFWASWCPPCRADMPNLVNAYKMYKGKGLEIVGISLDDSQENWAKGVKDLRITWPQISDLKGWDSELSKAYGVNSIPHTVLIDGEGKIIARGLHGEETLEKLKELFQ